MSMYKGPYLFEYIGALIRWLCLILFFPAHKNEKGLFKKVLAGENSLVERSWDTFFVNFFIGIIVVTSIVTAIVYFKK